MLYISKDGEIGFKSIKIIDEGIRGLWNPDGESLNSGRDFERNVLEKKYISRRFIMERYVCTVCGYVYDPAVGDIDHGVSSGTKFQDIDNEWVCPLCGVPKSDFEKAEK